MAERHMKTLKSTTPETTPRAPYTSPFALLGVLLLVAAGSNEKASAGERYVAVLKDGARLADDQVRDWHEPNASPTIGGKRLFEPNNPARWVVDQSLSPATPAAARVEFVTGDVFPGVVTSVGRGSDSVYDQPWDHLVVESPLPLDPPHQNHSSPRFRILPRWIKRIVWQSTGQQPPAPSTAVFRDGRSVAYRSLRWTSQGVRLLRDQGTIEVAFGDLAELHLPRIDPWHAYFEQLAWVNGELDQNMVRLETSDGMVVTTSDSRDDAQGTNREDTAQWRRRIQPAWSLDPFWVRFRSIRTQWYFPADRPPLTILEPVEVESRHALAHGWSWRAERNARGGPISSGGRGWGWGLGMQAFCRIEMPLPSCAVAVKTGLGLDDVVGAGGCAQGVVELVAGDAREVFRSPILVGSQQVVDSGRIPLDLGGKPAFLAISADPVYKNRPAGADPLDVRDCLDWLEPELELDRAQLAREVQSRVQGLIPAFAGWEVVDADPAPFALGSRWDSTQLYRASYRWDLAPRQKLVALAQEATIEAEKPWLALAVSRFEQGTTPSKIEVRVDGEKIAEHQAPIRYNHVDPEPLHISFAKFVGKTVQIEIRIPPAGPQARLDWRAIQWTAEPIGLKRIFDEEADFARKLSQGQGQALFDATEAFAGDGCLRVSPPGKGVLTWSLGKLPIREQPRLGEYRYLRFAWRKDGGTRICLELAHEGLLGPRVGREKQSFRYDSGTGDETEGAARRLTGKLPTEWEVVTRDLYADFGAFDLTGLNFNAVDGQWASFDYVYLAREPHYFDRIERKPTPKVNKERANLTPAEAARIEARRQFGEAAREKAQRLHFALSHIDSARKHAKSDPAKAKSFVQKALEMCPDEPEIKRQANQVLKSLQGKR